MSFIQRYGRCIYSQITTEPNTEAFEEDLKDSSIPEEPKNE